MFSKQNRLQKAVKDVKNCGEGQTQEVDNTNNIDYKEGTETMRPWVQF